MSIADSSHCLDTDEFADAPLRPNRADINRHLYELFPGEFAKDYPDAQIEIAYSNADGDVNAAETFSVFDVVGAGEFAAKKNATGCNVYAGVALRDAKAKGRASGENFLAACFSWAEFDQAGDDTRINAVLQEKNLLTAMVVVTGRTPHLRAHLYFRIEGCTDAENVKAANTALETLFGSDCVNDAIRLMRLAGTINYPSSKKRDRGYVTELVTLHVRKGAPTYPIEHLTGLAGLAMPTSSGGKPGRNDSELEALLEASRAPGAWHNSMRAAIATMIGRGWPNSAIRLTCKPYCEAGSGDDDLDDLIDGAREKWKKPDEEETPNAAKIEINRLAQGSPLEYEGERIPVAKRFGFRPSKLDDFVHAERVRLGLVEIDDDDGMQGRAISFPEPEPWPDKVDGPALLNAMAAAIHRHVVMSNTSSHIAALWVLHSWLIDCFGISPRLCVRSATKGCGKTLLLDVLGRMVRRPLRTLSITPAATFRVVEGWQPTLLIDEADTFLNDNEGLRGILDGNRKGDTVTRTVGNDFEVRVFATYGAVAIALIGTLPDTLHDRSVVIDLKRRLKKEKITPFRFDRAGHLDELARKAVRWAQDNEISVAATDPVMPKGIINREADNWRPLAAIAAVTGGRWPQRLAKAAMAAHAGTLEGDAASTLEMLLADIRDAFATDKAETRPDMFGAEQTEIASAVLVKLLVGLDGRPWAEMGKARKPLTPNRLARMLKPVKVAPKQVGPEDARVRGYVLADFKEAFERYLVPNPDIEASQLSIRPEAHEIRTSDIFEPSSPDDGWTDAKCEKPFNDGPLDGWTVGKGENGETRARHPVVTFFGVEPFDPCVQCGTTEGVVQHVRFNRHLGQPSLNLHEACIEAWLARHDESADG